MSQEFKELEKYIEPAVADSVIQPGPERTSALHSFVVTGNQTLSDYKDFLSTLEKSKGLKDLGYAEALMKDIKSLQSIYTEQLVVLSKYRSKVSESVTMLRLQKAADRKKKGSQEATDK